MLDLALDHDVRVARPSARDGFAVAVIVASVAFICVVTRPLQSLLTIVPDDTFYYLTTARNIATRGFSSFDGINPTNGYHPGWMALVVLCAKAFVGPPNLLRAALAMAFMFHIAESVCLVGALSRWVSRDWAYVGGALWVINPLPINFALEGWRPAFTSSLSPFLFGSIRPGWRRGPDSIRHKPGISRASEPV